MTPQNHTLQRLPIVGVMGSGQDPWQSLTQPLGQWLAQQPVHLLTGGGQGVMTAVSQAFVETQPRQGLALGIIPMDQDGEGFLPVHGYPNPFIEVPIMTPLPRLTTDPQALNRNMVNILTSQIVLACPGSAGTHQEVQLALTYRKPLALLGPHSAWVGWDTTLPRFEQAHLSFSWVLDTLHSLTTT